MNVLITAGGTSERIDDVRSITNKSTGKLGKEIALAFLKNPENDVYYICSKSAARPNNHPSCHIIEVDSVGDLLEALRTLLTKERMDAVIHSMAVSDYRLDGALPELNLADALANDIVSTLKEISPEKMTNPIFWQSIIENNLASEKLIDSTTKKISSDYDALYLKLVKAPKVISDIKKWQSNTILVGFKLLVKTPKENLLTVAKNLLQKNKCDFVLANDLNQINQDQHIGYLISANGTIFKGETKHELARLIEEKVTAQFITTQDIR